MNNKFQANDDQESLGTENPLLKSKTQILSANELGQRILCGIFDVGQSEPKVSKDVNNDELEDLSQSIARYSSMFTQTVTFTCAANVALVAGDVIECKFPLTKVVNLTISKVVYIL